MMNEKKTLTFYIGSLNFLRIEFLLDNEMSHIFFIFHLKTTHTLDGFL